jgi:hypothetical protein
MKTIERYAKRGVQCDVMKALTLLTKAYISLCGISLGCRTVVYCAAESWQERLAWLDLPLSEMARKESFVNLMPHISEEYVPEEYDKYDIASLQHEDLLNICSQMIREKQFDKTTLEVISWGSLKVTEDKELLSKRIEVTAPDGTSLTGTLQIQDCSKTLLIMNEPYHDLCVAKYELVRDARELLLTAYMDYQRLHQLEKELRALYPDYLDRLSKLEKDSAWEKYRIYRDIYGKLLDDMVLVGVDTLIEEFFGLRINR